MPLPPWQTTDSAQQRIAYTLSRDYPHIGIATTHWILNHAPLIRKVIELGECATRAQIMELVEAEIVMRSLGGDDGAR